jgi:hypothetical protein
MSEPMNKNRDLACCRELPSLHRFARQGQFKLGAARLEVDQMPSVTTYMGGDASRICAASLL